MPLLIPTAGTIPEALLAMLPFLAGAIGAAALALLVAAALGRRAGGGAGAARAQGAAFLFDGDRLRDANAAGWDLIARAGGITALPDLVAALSASYPGLAARLADGAEEGAVPEREAGRAPVAFARGPGGLRLTVPILEGGALAAGGAHAGKGGVVVDAAVFAAMEDELGTLRTALDAVPAPVWRTEPGGAVQWANAAYLDRAGGDRSAWPPAPLFDPAEMADLPPPDSPRRLRAAGAGNAAGGWFDVSRPLGDVALHCALPADEAVSAEASLRGFAMALTDTFAHLPIGLAVFDATGRLKLFNPALAELTEIPAGVLAARPSLRDILDRLREARLLPEPGDWHEWKDRVARLESDARSGTYLETWDVEGGRTWRVAGRPHPGGAMALLIEDVSSEVLLARRFRAEIEIGSGIADAIPEAIAVFGREGVLLSSNAAYAAMWGVDPRTELREVTVSDACRTWMARARPSGVWGELREAVTGGGARAEWGATVGAGDERLHCRCVPLAGGATMIGFRREDGGAMAAPAPVPAPALMPRRLAAE